MARRLIFVQLQFRQLSCLIFGCFFFSFITRSEFDEKSRTSILQSTHYAMHTFSKADPANLQAIVRICFWSVHSFTSVRMNRSPFLIRTHTNNAKQTILLPCRSVRQRSFEGVAKNIFILRILQLILQLFQAGIRWIACFSFLDTISGELKITNFTPHTSPQNVWGNLKNV